MSRTAAIESDSSIVETESVGSGRQAEVGEFKGGGTRELRPFIYPEAQRVGVGITAFDKLSDYKIGEIITVRVKTVTIQRSGYAGSGKRTVNPPVNQLVGGVGDKGNADAAVVRRTGRESYVKLVVDVMARRDQIGKPDRVACLELVGQIHG